MVFNARSYSVLVDSEAFRAIVWTMACLSLPFNIMVICRMLFKYSFKRRVKLSYGAISFHSNITIKDNPTLFILFNLAIADLLGGVYLFILAFSDIYFTHYYTNMFKSVNITGNHSLTNQWVRSVGCFSARFIAQICIYMKAAMSLAIAVNRFRSVYKPYARRSGRIRWVRILVLLCWILSVIVAGSITIASYFVLLHRRRIPFTGFRHICLFDRGLGTYLRAFGFGALFLGFVCYVVVITLYIMICLRLKASNFISNSNLSEIVHRRLQMLCVTIVLTDILTYVSVTAFSITHLNQSRNVSSWNEILPITSLCLFTNCVIDPVIYIVFWISNSSTTVGWLRKLNCQRLSMQNTSRHLRRIRSVKVNSEVVVIEPKVLSRFAKV